ncbi:MAG: WD40 repeat domain-containing protein, partial [Deltaproteobacteria bacterium]|nr:WD40 repeat domain-containing protein [Deltaproteobacteria bacterium]
LVHAPAVTALSFHPDGKIIASGNLAGTIRLWDVSTGRLIKELLGHGGKVSTLVFSPDGRMLASGSWDFSVRLWNVSDGKEKQKLVGHESPVRSIAFSPDGRRLASGSGCKSVYYLGEDHSPKVCGSSSKDQSIRLWDLSNGKEIQKLTRDMGDVVSIAFSPDGKLLASSSGDDSVRIWELSMGKGSKKLDERGFGFMEVKFGPDGKQVYGRSGSNLVSWKPTSGEKLKWSAGRVCCPTSRSNTFVIDQEGKGLVSCGMSKPAEPKRQGSVAVISHWDLNGRKKEELFLTHVKDIRSMTFSPDGHLAAFSDSEGRITLWNLEKGKEISKRTEGHSSTVSSVAYSQDGKRLASMDTEGNLIIWNISSGAATWRKNLEYDGVAVVSFVQGDVIATAYEKKIKVLNVSNGNLMAQYNTANQLRTMDLSQDGKRLAVGDSEGSIKIVDVRDGKEIAEFTGHEGLVLSVSFSPDGMSLLSGGAGPLIRTWDVVTGEMKLEFDTGSRFVWQVRFANVDKNVVWAVLEKSIVLVDLKTGKIMKRLDTSDTRIFGLALNTEKSHLAAGAMDGTVRVWNIADEIEVKRFVGHGGPIGAITFSPDGKFIASAGMDTTILIWKTDLDEKGKE